MRTLTKYELIDKNSWRDFVANNSLGNIFLTPEFFQVCIKTKYYEPVIIIAYDDSNNIQGLLVSVIQKEGNRLLGLMSARSIIFGGPLVQQNNYKVLNLILKTYNNLIKGKVIYSQVRNFTLINKENKNIFINNGFTFTDHLNIILDLSIGADKLWSGCSKSRKKGIKKAYSGGLDFRIGQNGKYLDEFYNLLSISYKRIKLPFPDKLHFEQIITNLQSDNYKIFTISQNKDYIAALLVLIFKNTMYGYYLGSTSDTTLLKQKPIDLLFWEVFKWAIENKIKYFDWMGAGKPDKEYRVRDFKLQYGGELINLGRFEKIHKPFLYKISRFGLNIWKITK